MDKIVADWVCFEDDVYAAVSRQLAEAELLIDPKRAVAHRRRRYYSEQRKNEIEFEIAIEAFDVGATEPSLVWVWECKDNTKSQRRVEVADVEVLASKLDQLGPSRFKASLVTTHGFQKSALTLAKAKGIGLYTFQKELHRVFLYSRDEPRSVLCTLIAVKGHDEFGSLDGDYFELGGLVMSRLSRMWAGRETDRGTP